MNTEKNLLDNASNIENFDDGGVTLRQAEGDDDDSDMKIYVKGETYIPRHQSRKYGKDALRATSFRERARKLNKKVKTTFERLTVLDEDAKIVEDYGAETLGKDILADDPNETCDDTTFVDAEKGIFAVFDGAGGEKGAAIASGMAADGMRDFVASRTPKNSEDLGQILTSLSGRISRNEKAGVTTAVVGRIGVRNGKRTLSYASAGDSRIYVVQRDGEVKQITEDEITRKVYFECLGNGLGHPDFRMEKMGEVALHKGDMVLFCSDGITGNNGKNKMSNEEIARIFRSRAKSKNRAREITHALINKAKKIDDRTAIVVDVK